MEIILVELILGQKRKMMMRIISNVKSSIQQMVKSLRTQENHSINLHFLENLNQSQQLAYELLKNEINTYWNRPLISTISMSYLIEFVRQLIEYSLIANNFTRTLIVCLETLPCKLIENK